MGTLKNREDPDCGISSGSALFSKIKSILGD